MAALLDTSYDKDLHGFMAQLSFKTTLSELLILHSRLGAAHERELAALKNERKDIRAENLSLLQQSNQGVAGDWAQLAVKAPHRPFTERPPPGRLQQVILPISPAPTTPPAPDIGKLSDTSLPLEEDFALSVSRNDSIDENQKTSKDQIQACQIHCVVPATSTKIHPPRQIKKNASFLLDAVEDNEDENDSEELEAEATPQTPPPMTRGYTEYSMAEDSFMEEPQIIEHVPTDRTLGPRVGKPGRDTIEQEDELRKMQALWAGMEDEEEIVQAYLDGANGTKRTCRSIAFHIVYGNTFQVFFAVAIMLNSVFLGVEVDHSASNPNDSSPVLLYIIGYIFIALFLFELIIRLIAEGCSFFCNVFWAWNWLDFIIVTFSIVEIVFDVINFSNGTHDKKEGSVSNMRIVRMIRLTRIIRIFRVARIVALIRALHTLVYQIMGTLRSVFWALILLLLTIYVFAMVFCQAATNYISTTDNWATKSPTLWQYWGSLPRCMFTLYKAIIGGVDWEHVVIPLSEMHWFWVLMFIGYVSFTVFAMMNVMTGVFCQSAIESAQLDQDMVIQQHLLRKKLFVKKIRTLFEDIGNKGGDRRKRSRSKEREVITFRAFERHLQEEKVNAYFESLGLDTTDAWGLFKLLDTDESQEVDLEEFVAGCLRLRGHAKAVDVAKISLENKLMRKKLSSWMKRIDENVATLVDPGSNRGSGASQVKTSSFRNIQQRISINTRVDLGSDEMW